MQGAIARVCMVVAATILNHPLLFPRENTTLPEQDEELLARMREHEERLEVEKAKLEEELSQLDSKQEESVAEEGDSWYFWSVVSFLIFFVIEICRVDLAEAEPRPAEDEDETGGFMSGVKALDKTVLRNFSDRCSYTSTHENSRVREFIEGFADDLLESLQSGSDRETDMEIGDFVGVGSMFESWSVCKPQLCDVMVPLIPPEPHRFQYRLWSGASSDVPPDMQGCGAVQLTPLAEGEEGCLCGSADLGEDMLCLLHRRNSAAAASRSLEKLLCSKDTQLFSKHQVMRWFQVSVTRAWRRIAHKYDFEVTFRDLHAAGALKIRFRSGKAVVLNLIPAVRLEDSHAYFVSYFPSDPSSCPDPYWSLSLAVYERNLLKYFTKRLPQDACHLHCLQVVAFLHRKQSALTGECGLTTYHLKTAVLQLLLSLRTSAWGAESLEPRLRDVLDLLGSSLREKRLYHALIGNGKLPEEVGLPEALREAEPVNLFRGLVLQRGLHAASVEHLQQMLRNAPVLIQEYSPHFANGSLHRSLEESL